MLTDGSRWHICSMPGAENAAEGLISAMSLERDCMDDSVPTVTYLPRGMAESLIAVNATHDGASSNEWDIYDVDGHALCVHTIARDMLVEVADTAVLSHLVTAMRHATLSIFLSGLGSGNIPVHSGLVELDGKGILLVAPSGVGKSTCCRRIPAPWRAMCDDQTLLVRTREGRYQAHPFPTYSNFDFGKPQRQWTVEESVPLHAICFVKQAAEDGISPLSTGEAASYLCGSSIVLFNPLWDTGIVSRSAKSLILDNACALSRSVPSHMLDVSLEGQFWNVLEQIL